MLFRSIRKYTLFSFDLTKEHNHFSFVAQQQMAYMFVWINAIVCVSVYLNLTTRKSSNSRAKTGAKVQLQRVDTSEDNVEPTKWLRFNIKLHFRLLSHQQRGNPYFLFVAATRSATAAIIPFRLFLSLSFFVLFLFASCNWMTQK